MDMAETRAKKAPGRMREVLGRNLNGLMNKVFADSSNRPLSLSRKAGMSLSNIQRIVKGEQGASLEKIEDLAKALEVFPYQLLIPNLDCDNPQVANGATPAEKHLYARMQSAKSTPAHVSEAASAPFKKPVAKRKKSNVEK